MYVQVFILLSFIQIIYLMQQKQCERSWLTAEADLWLVKRVYLGPRLKWRHQRDGSTRIRGILASYFFLQWEKMEKRCPSLNMVYGLNSLCLAKLTFLP